MWEVWWARSTGMADSHSRKLHQDSTAIISSAGKPALCAWPFSFGSQISNICIFIHQEWLLLLIINPVNMHYVSWHVIVWQYSHKSSIKQTIPTNRQPNHSRWLFTLWSLCTSSTNSYMFVKHYNSQHHIDIANQVTHWNSPNPTSSTHPAWCSLLLELGWPWVFCSR